MRLLLTLTSLLLSSAFTHAFQAQTVQIASATELTAALRALSPGTTLRIAPGDYTGSYSISGIERVTIEAADPQNPPHFQGGKQAWHFSRCPHLTVRHLRISGQSLNGLNLDDGGQLTDPVPGITLEHLDISDIGPKGNHDGIKASGLTGLTIRSCRITGWGGQGIDFVGCQKSLITGCTFTGKEGFTASAAIQMKGGTHDITVEKNHFKNAGERPLNIGGSTGLPYFRAPDAPFEARNIIVRENTIEGSSCAAAFVGVDGAEFTDNQILYPTRWIFRILQESTGERFVPCRNVLIKNNRIKFRRADIRSDVNIGGNTAPETFRFVGNHWFAEDNPAQSKPTLPVPETDPVYGQASR